MNTDSNNDYDLAQFNQNLVQLYTEIIQQWKDTNDRFKERKTRRMCY